MTFEDFLTEAVAIYCDTKEDWQQFMQMCYEEGLEFRAIHSPKDPRKNDYKQWGDSWIVRNFEPGEERILSYGGEEDRNHNYTLIHFYELEQPIKVPFDKKEFTDMIL
jgi:hypothetical protein